MKSFILIHVLSLTLNLYASNHSGYENTGYEKAVQLIASFDNKKSNTGCEVGFFFDFSHEDSNFHSYVALGPSGMNSKKTSIQQSATIIAELKSDSCRVTQENEVICISQKKVSSVRSTVQIFNTVIINKHFIEIQNLEEEKIRPLAAALNKILPNKYGGSFSNLHPKSSRSNFRCDFIKK